MLALHDHFAGVAKLNETVNECLEKLVQQFVTRLAFEMALY